MEQGMAQLRPGGEAFGFVLPGQFAQDQRNQDERQEVAPAPAVTRIGQHFQTGVQTAHFNDHPVRIPL
jgi:hypothetical protein